MKQNPGYFLISILLLYCITAFGETAMRMFKQNKLWRDKLIEMMEQNYGSRIHWRLLDEVAAANNRDSLIGELADLHEVIDSIASLHGISKEEIIAVQTKKREDRGGFMGRRFVEVAEHPVGSFGENYCLADPEKYPEIV